MLLDHSFNYKKLNRKNINIDSAIIKRYLLVNHFDKCLLLLFQINELNTHYPNCSKYYVKTLEHFAL